MALPPSPPRTPPPSDDPTVPLSPLTPISPWPPVPSSTAAETSELPSAKEIYGFLGVLLTYFSFGLYLSWAILPSGWIDRIGWTWYPSREWALIVPCYLMLIVLLTYWSYSALVALRTPPFDSPQLITDIHANIPSRRAESDPYYWKFADRHAIPEAVDLPIDLVNRVLYPPRQRHRNR
ncbi:hypothetical protein EHS25_001504 [Saitozyma podzolica]|uniref:PIG-P domain-containing protein n=1 Tax=Saitozyma podzolica TaxID=1890683 RepID=A0A427YGG6_9TREE|nr:hypothetical protein EHS25_001504 [Saitozyma podzolica]